MKHKQSLNKQKIRQIYKNQIFMNWNTTLENYKTYLIIEKSLTSNSIEAYLSDIRQVISFLEERNIGIEDIQPDHLQSYIESKVDKEKVTSRTESRIISSIKSFFKFLEIDNIINSNPSLILVNPKIKRKIPTTLTDKEVENIFKAVEMYKPEGKRNRAIIAVLYNCGLRVSELINLKLTDINFNKNTVHISGERERTLHLNPSTKEEIKEYIQGYRNYLDIQSESENILFLNKRGTAISRVMIFNIIKHLAKRAQIKKQVSPCIFRHTFANNQRRKGIDLMNLKIMLGHSSVVTTEIYQ